MFEWMGMIGNYQQRCVCNTKRDDFTLDTAMVTDRDWRYETAVSHNNFRSGDWIILEGCYNKDEAQLMHDKWLKRLEKNNYDVLTDCYDEEDFYRE